MSEPRSSLLHGLWSTSQAISDASQAEQVGQALMAFAAGAGVDVARLLLFTDWHKGQPSCIEMREGWTIDQRPAQPYGTRLPMDSYPLFPLMRPDQPIVCEDVTVDPRATELVRQLMALSGVASFVIVPLRARERWLGALFLGRNTPSTYSEEMVSLAWILASQAGGALQHLEAEHPASEVEAPHPSEARLPDGEGRGIGLTAISRDMAGLKAAQEAAQHRATVLAAAADISKAATSVLDPDELVRQAVDLIRERFELYYVGLFLIESVPRHGEEAPNGLQGQWAVLRAGTGEAGRQMLAQGHRLAVGGQSMIGWCVAHSQARIALDVGEEAVRFDNPLLPDTRSELALPLMTRGEAIGAITIQSTRQAAFDSEDIAALQSMADQLGNAIGNARLFRDRERRLAELAVVNDIGRALSSALEIDELLETVYEQVGRLFDTTNFYIALYEDGSPEWFSALHFEDGVRQPPLWHGIEAGMTGYILRTGQTLHFGSREENQEFVLQHGIKTLGTLARSWLAVPLIAADKRVGVICIQNYEHDSLYDEHDEALFTTVAAQVAVAIDNLRLLADARRRAEQQEAVNEVGRAITSVLDLDSVLDEIVNITKEHFGAYFVSLLLLEREQLIYRAGTTIGNSDIGLEPRTVVIDLASSQGLSAEALRTGQPLLVNDVSQDPRYLSVPALAATCSELDVPIRAKGQVIGVLDMQADRTHAYDDTTAALLQSLADQAGVAIENARLFRETSQRTTETQALYSIALRLGTRMETPELLRVIVEQALALLDAATGAFYVYDAQQDELVLEVAVGYLHNWIGTRLKPGTGLAGRVFQQRQPEVMADYHAWAERAEAYADEERLHGLMAVPVIGREGVLGVLDIAVGAHKPALGEHDVWLAQSFAALAATALDSARLFEQIETTAADTARLYEASRLVVGALNMDEVLAAILVYTRPLDLDQCMLVLLEDPAAAPAERVAIVRAAWDRRGRQAEYVGDRFDVMQVPIMQVLGPGDRVVVEDWTAALPAGIDEGTRATFDRLGIGATALVPLAVGGRLMGWLLAATLGQPQRFPERELDGLEAMAGQAAAALDNLRLLDEADRRAQELQALNEVGRTVTSVLDLDSVLMQIVDITKQRFGYYFVGIALVEGDLVTYRSGSTIGDTDRRLEARRVDLALAGSRGLIAEAASTGQPLVVADVLSDPRYISLPELIATQAEIDVPIMAKGTVTGVLSVQTDRPLVDVKRTISLLQALADQAGVAIDNARLFADAQRAEMEQRRRSEELAQLQQVSMELAFEQRDLASVLETISTRAMSLLDSDGGGVWLWRENEQELELVLDHQVGGVHFAGRRLKPGEGLSGRAFSERTVQIIDNYLDWNGHAAAFDDAPFSSGMAAPMVWQNQAVGVMVVTRSRRDQPYTTADRSLAELLAAQATAFIQNARLFEQAQLRAGELAILNEMGRSLGQALTVADVLTAIRQHASRLMDTTIFYVALYDADRDMVEFPLYIEGAETRESSRRARGNGLTEHVIALGRPVLIKDNVSQYQAAAGITRSGTPSLSWLGVPMIVANRTIGVVCVQSYTTPGLYDEHDRDLLAAIAGQAAIAVETARLFEQSQQRTQELTVLNEMSRSLGEALSVPDVLTTLHQHTSRLMDTTNFFVALYDAEQQMIHFPLYAEGAERRQVASRPRGTGLTEHVMDLGRPVLIKENLDAYESSTGIAGVGTPALSWLGVPMIVANRTIGVVCVQSYTTPGLYDEHDRDLLAAVAGQAASAVETARLFEQQQHTAALLANRVRQLDCLSDIGRKVQEMPPVPEFLEWVTGRLPAAMRHPEICQVAVEFHGQPFGEPGAVHLARQMVQAVKVAGQTAGHVYVSYTEEEPFLDEESALLGEVVRRISGYIESQDLLEETRQAARRLAEERALLRTVIDTLPDLVYVKDRESRFLIDNAAQLRALGAESQAEVLGRTDFDYFPPEQAQAFYADERQVIEDEQPLLDKEEYYTDRLGNTIWIQTSKVPLRDSQGKVTGLVGIGRDITERVQTEAALKRRGAQLQCLSDIGQRIGEAPPVPEFMRWMAERIPAAMQYPAACVAAVELDAEIYGEPEALTLPRQMVQRLGQSQAGGQGSGRVAIAYREEHEFLNEESALLGEIVRRIDGYLDNRRLFDQVQASYAEARTLYNASRRLAAATDLQAIVAAVTEEVPMPAVDRAIAWELQRNDLGEAIGFVSIANWSSEGGHRPLPVGVRFNLAQLPAMRYALSTEPILLEDVEHDARLDGATRMLFLQQQARSTALLPMWLAGRQIGLLMLVTPEPYHFREAELQPYLSLIGQIAIGIENRRLLEETRSSLARTEALYAASSLANVLDDVQEVLQAIANGVAAALPADRVLLAVLDQAQQRVTHHAWAGPGSAGLELAPYDELWTGLTGWVLREGKPAISPKGTIDPRESPEAQRRRAETQSGSVVVVPLIYRGEIMGTLSAINRLDQPDFAGGLELMATMANQAAAVVRSAQLFEQTQRALTETEVLYRASAALSAAGSYEDVLATLRAQTLLAQADRSVSLNLYDDAWTEDSVPEWASVVARYSQLPAEVHSPRFALRGWPIMNVLRPDQPFAVEDVTGDPRLDRAAIELYHKQFDAHSVAVFPLVAAGQWIGHVEAMFGATTHFPAAQIQQIMILAGQAAVAVQNLRQFEQVQAALEEVEATHRRYLQGRWQAYLQQREALLQAGYLYDQARAAGPEAVRMVPNLWRPELSDALRTATRAQTPLRSASPQAQIAGAATAGAGEDLALAGPDAGGDQRAGLAVPIILRGQTIGVLGIEDPAAGRQWSEAEIELLEEVSQQLALALENARLFEESQRRAERERLITEITARIRASTDMVGVLETTATELGKALRTSRAIVRLTAEEDTGPSEQGSREGAR